MFTVGGAALALVLARTPALAESDSGACEDATCEEDGGSDVPPPDAGSDGGISMAGGTGGMDGGSDDEGVACSCHTDSEEEIGARIHVCTESFDPDVCRDFGCERGTLRSRGCSGDGARLCCAMRSRGLQTYLYEDCSHPNCESGFREQCREFGGNVSQGACEGSDASGGAGDADAGDSSSMCSVRARPGRGAAFAGLVALLALALLVRLTRRCAPARR